MRKLPELKPKSELGERWTEDDIARAKLGEVKGSKDLPAAPLTKREREQTPRRDEDDGHPA